MSKRTLALILGLIILTLVLLSVALTPLFKKSPEVPTQPSPEGATATPTPPAYTTINLSPNPVTISQTGTVDVVIDTKINEVTAVQLEVAYDPAYITAVSLKPGSFFPSPVELLNTIDKETGRITYALGITPAQSPVSGTGTVATITFQKNPTAPSSQTQVDLLPKTLVTQQGIGASVLKSAVGTTIILQNNPAVSQIPQDVNPTTVDTVPTQ